ncbi:hypothetical protein C8J57DRAFT_127634 [Mycena rebaudengoi]|nr:hypothetical protein C8J57DRAFT_127634 [Mycena rebaudengoi]
MVPSPFRRAMFRHCAHMLARRGIGATARHRRIAHRSLIPYPRFLSPCVGYPFHMRLHRRVGYLEASAGLVDGAHTSRMCAKWRGGSRGGFTFLRPAIAPLSRTLAVYTRGRPLTPRALGRTPLLAVLVTLLHTLVILQCDPTSFFCPHASRRTRSSTTLSRAIPSFSADLSRASNPVVASVRERRSDWARTGMRSGYADSQPHRSPL